MANKNIYFPGLSGVRCIAAFMVVFQHIESFKQKAGKPGLLDNAFIRPLLQNLGHHGVMIFFVLSGFLITYLLLKEKQATATINIKKFYARRILRIWPLYFLIVLLGFFIFPHIINPVFFPVKTNPYFFEKLTLTVFFLPNVVLFIYGSIFSIGVLWSIGTEEQFYIAWPHVLKKVGQQKLFRIFLSILMAIVLIKLACFAMMTDQPSFKNKIVFIVFHSLEYDAMVIGGIVALAYHCGFAWTKYLHSKKIQICALVLLFTLYFLWPDAGPVTNLIFCPLYAILILNIAIGTNSIIRLTNPVLNYLGTISYGIYLFHSIAVATVIIVLNKYGFNFSSWFTNLLLYIGASGATILISSLSYRLFESPVLKFKSKFMIIKSGAVS